MGVVAYLSLSGSGREVGWALIRGWALMRGWALIRINTVFHCGKRGFHLVSICLT